MDYSHLTQWKASEHPFERVPAAAWSVFGLSAVLPTGQALSLQFLVPVEWPLPYQTIFNYPAPNIEAAVWLCAEKRALHPTASKWQVKAYDGVYYEADKHIRRTMEMDLDDAARLYPVVAH